MWEQAEAIYGTITPAKMYFLFRKTRQWHLDGSKHPQPQLDALDYLYKQLTTQTVNIADFIKAMTLLCVLPPQWEESITTIMMQSGTITGITYNAAKTTILHHWDALNARKSGKKAQQVNKISSIPRKGPTPSFQNQTAPSHHSGGSGSSTFGKKKGKVHGTHGKGKGKAHAQGYGKVHLVSFISAAPSTSPSLLDLLPPPFPLVPYLSPLSEQGIHSLAFYPLLPWEPSSSLPRPAFMHPLSPHQCLDNIDPLVAGFTTPPHSTPSPQPPPQGAVPRPTSPSLCAPPLPLSSPRQCRHPHCCNMQHPLTPHGGLTAPQGYFSLVPSPSPYQRLVWCLVVRWGTCGSHGRFSFLSDLQWSTHPPSSWPGSGTSSVLPQLPAWSGGLGLRLWASATCLVVQTSQSRPWLVLTAPWLFRCSLVHVWAPALRPLSPLPLLHYDSPLLLRSCFGIFPPPNHTSSLYLTVVLRDVIVTGS